MTHRLNRTLCPLTAALLLVLCFAPPSTAEELWSATSVAWLSTGDDGKFINPRIICSKQGFTGVAWEERHKEWSRAGLTLHVGRDWKVFPLPVHRKINGVAASVNAFNEPVVLYGYEGGLVTACLSNGRWQSKKLADSRGKALDIVTSRGRFTYALFATREGVKSEVFVARKALDKWTVSQLALPGKLASSLTGIGPGRLALGQSGRPQALFLALTKSGSSLLRARSEAGGWAVEQVTDNAPRAASTGRMGLAFDSNGNLLTAFMEEGSRRLLLLDCDNAPTAIEPDPGCTLRWPQVDLAYDTQGRAHIIYFAVTPDGGLQIRLARRRNGEWDSRMIDRTMSKNSLASLSLGLSHGAVPYLAYALGPARAVLLAYPKNSAPPGIGPRSSRK